MASGLAGRVSNDTFSPLRTLLRGGPGAHRVAPKPPRARSYRRSAAVSFGSGLTARSPAAFSAAAHASAANADGRWSLLPAADADPNLRAAVTAGLLLDRYGVVTRGAVQAEQVPGGFAQTYRVLAGYETAGHCRRGYLIDGLGGAQFATSAVVDRIREYAAQPDPPPRQAITLAATDPANPYGAALAWPVRDAGEHRPSRKAGGLVVLVDGALVLYLERGGRTVLTFSADESVLGAALRDLAASAQRYRLATITVERVGGEFIYGTPAERAFRAAGFTESPRGLTLRAAVGAR